MLKALLDKLESYGFECEAGPLTMCADWQKLRAALTSRGWKCPFCQYDGLDNTPYNTFCVKCRRHK